MVPDAAPLVSGVVVLVVGLVVGGGVALALWVAHRRHQERVAWATARGWRLRARRRDLERRWRGRPFAVGHSRRATSVLTGTYAGRPATSFQYQCTVGSGKNQQRRVFHVVAVRLPTSLPTLELTPEGLATRIATALGGQDIDFESEEFNRAWRVQSRDPRFAHAVVHPRLMERLLQPDASTPVRIEGADVLTWSPGPQRVELIEPRLAVLTAVADAIPRFVWQQNGYDPLNRQSGGPSWT